jgi:hypothetical protein
LGTCLTSNLKRDRNPQITQIFADEKKRISEEPKKAGRIVIPVPAPGLNHEWTLTSGVPAYARQTLTEGNEDNEGRQIKITGFVSFVAFCKKFACGAIASAQRRVIFPIRAIRAIELMGSAR